MPEHSTVYTDAVIRAALATLAVRDTVPDAEKLSLLPFTIGDLSGFRVQNILAGRAVLLGDTPELAGAQDLHPPLFIGVFPGGPSEPDDRAEFARDAFSQIVGIEDVHINFLQATVAHHQPARLSNRGSQAKDHLAAARISWSRSGCASAAAAFYR